MNDRELLYVKTIADTKSISKAAKKLYIAQPSLSQAIQKIEDDIGTKLFLRNHDGMKLTLAGEKYYITAKEILNIYNDFKNEVTYINDLKKGRVTFGITSYLATYLLPKLMPEFIEKYPNIEVYIMEENSTMLERSLLNGSIDFAIMHKSPLPEKSSIFYDVIFKDSFLIVTKKNHPLSSYKIIDEKLPYPILDINLFKDEKFILVEKDKRIRQVSDLIFSISAFSPNISLVVKSFETARRLASTGFGVTIVPKNYIKIFEGLYDADYYYIKENKYDYWETCIAVNQNMYLSKAAKAFMDLIYTYFKEQQPI
ncbi:MAG: LysR family transcriptional regulator [Eubacteriales bacterium]|nr:LysR family transcriptional regulator [Eubacteriales bacterium]